MIGLIDYGLGNIQAFANIYKQLGMSASIIRIPADLDAAERLVLPGVGAFDWAMKQLNRSGLRDKLDDLVLTRGIPVLGVCVGMQMMATRSDEGREPGLGWIDATVKKFDLAGHFASHPLPHMGWNDAQPVRQSTLFEGIIDPRFYFLHSFYIETSPELCLAQSLYGEPFTCAIQSQNVSGTQFHPEKSHHWGVQLLKNFGGAGFAAT